mgnify:CR=1 FL=1
METSTLSEFPAFFSLTPSRYEEMQREILRLRAQIQRERNKDSWYRIKQREIDKMREAHAAEIERLITDPFAAVRLAWKAHQARYPESTPRFRSAIQQAYKRGIAWELEPDDYEALASQPCCSCGGPTGGGIGLDRLNHRFSYRIDNVRSMCGPCNVARVRRPLPPE